MVLRKHVAGYLVSTLAIAPFSFSAYGVEPVTIELTLKNATFQPAEVKAPAATPIVLKIKNEDAAPEEFESATLKVEKIVAGLGEATIRIKPLAAGRHEFHGEYHQDTAKGVLVIE